jgi:hypothetical protein
MAALARPPMLGLFFFRAGPDQALIEAAEKVGPKPYQAGWRDAALVRSVKLQCDYLLARMPLGVVRLRMSGSWPVSTLGA